MPHGILITATAPAAGKTLIGCALAFAAHARGMRVGVMKPIAMGCREAAGVLECVDARGLAYAAACDLPMETICPYRYQASTVAIEGPQAPDLPEIARAYGKVAARSDFTIVEGFDALAAPFSIDAASGRVKDSADLARTLNLAVVIVARNDPGCLNATRSAVHYARSRGIGIVGLVLNDVAESCSTVTDTKLELMRKILGVPILGRVRFKQPVPREIIDPILNRIEAWS